MDVEPQRLKKFLLDAELITEEKFNEALKKSQKLNKNVGSVLISEGLIEQEKLTKFQAYLLGIPFVNIGKEPILPEILNIIPEQIARAHNIIAFRKQDNNLEVAMLDPEDLITIEFIKKTDPLLKILPRLTTPEGVRNALNQYQKSLGMEFANLKIGEESINHIKEEKFDDGKKEELAKAAQELPVIGIVDTLLKHAVLQEASDIHVEPMEKEIAVRFRIDGILHNVMALPISIAQAIVARVKVISNLKLDEHRLPQDGRFKIETDDYKYSVRVSVLPVFNGEKIVMRLLSEDTKTQSLEKLGFVGKALEKIRDNLIRPTGMILITGPTGSGKTTTLYAMMDILNTPAVNISTIEDPVEYRMPRINQTQVNTTVGLTFASGLRALVRQDPNIIMVGEIRDSETANLAINAALTGHLVLSTLHTTEAAGAIPRLIDMGAEPFLISSTLNVVVAQRLVRKLHGDKEKYKLKAEHLESLARYCDLDRVLKILKEEKLVKSSGTLKDIELYKPKPSKDSSSGYKGRIGIFEVLQVNEEIKNLIVQKVPTKEITLQAKKEGMRTIVEDGFVKAVQGLTSIEEVLRVIID
ncbi:MAG: Flp pilus assembly complex ATPase component TadA [Candidatus Staskawiczbacteria bacterium]|nr:Flp pilus assembly complex ATPase component TadA [Candidatus Staskawiczbacteria bacterium]